jgi:hypothetical protein
MDDLVTRLRSQIGDDVQHIYDHEALFKQAAARIAELEALLKETKEVLRDVVADENCWGVRAEALLARLEES